MLHQAMISVSIIHESLSHSATNRRLPLLWWLRVSHGQDHEQDPLLVGTFTTHTDVFLPVGSGAYDTSLAHSSALLHLNSGLLLDSFI